MGFVIDDTTAFSYDPRCGLMARDYARVPYGAIAGTSPFAEAVEIIPESEWADRIKAMEGRWIRNLYTDTVPDKSQGSLPYCWAWSLAQCIEAVRAVEGQPHVELAPVSLGGSVGFRKSGNYCGKAIVYCAENGFCDATFPDSPHSVSPDRWKAGWQDEAKNHKCLEFWELGTSSKMWAETVTALLCGFPVYVGYNFWGHAVMLDQLVMQGSEICVSGPNSWGPNQRFALRGSRKIPSEAYVPSSTTWSRT